MSATPAVDVDVLVVGAGFAGLLAAIKLKARGDLRFEVLEKAADLGGTWLANRYPGAACDVPSHLYSYSFAPNPNWSRSFSTSEEIWRYLDDCAARYDIRRHIRFDTPVTALRWHAQDGIWSVTTGGGQVRRARCVILGTGALSRPALPDVPGLDAFSGPVFHSARWNHDCPLDGKTVAIVGSGASAIQFLPRVAERAARVVYFQRTPPWVLPKLDRRISALEHRSYARWPIVQRLVRGAIYWSLELRVAPFVRFPVLMQGFQALARLHIRAAVKSKALRKIVTPAYRFGCKRVLLSNDYYPALNRDNVEVLPVGATRVTAHSVVAADGSEHAADVIVLGTGFRASEPFDRGFVTRDDGTDLLDAWRDGPEAYRGTVVAGFPNLFFLAGPNTGLGHSSMIYMLESQVAFVMSALDALARDELPCVEVCAAAQRRYNDSLQRALGRSVWNTGGCRSWYQHKNGKNVALWPGFTWRFRQLTRAVDLADFARRSE